MNISLQNIRRLGYLKINQSIDPAYIITKASEIDNNFYSEVHISPFSLPKRWKRIDPVTKDKLRGISQFMLSCEAMIENIEADEFTQRRFRNRYDRLWQEYSYFTCIPLEDAQMLENFSIKLVYILSQQSHPDVDNIIKYVDAVIAWYLITQTDVTLREFGYTCLDLLTMLSLKTDNEFVEFLTKEAG